MVGESPPLRQISTVSALSSPGGNGRILSRRLAGMALSAMRQHVKAGKLTRESLLS